MNLNMLLDYFEEYNEHELFYREYYEKKKNEKGFLKFLHSLDPQYIKLELAQPVRLYNNMHSTLIMVHFTRNQLKKQASPL